MGFEDQIEFQLSGVEIADKYSVISQQENGNIKTYCIPSEQNSVMSSRILLILNVEIYPPTETRRLT